MTRIVTIKWKPRHGGRSKKARRAGLSHWEIGALVVVFAAMGAPWLLTAGRERRGDHAHVVALRAVGSGYAGPFGKGRVELSFPLERGARHARVGLFAATGERFAPIAGTVVYLERPLLDGGRERIDFAQRRGALVSTRPVAGLADRSSLVFDEGRLRHVYALDRERRR